MIAGFSPEKTNIYYLIDKQYGTMYYLRVSVSTNHLQIIRKTAENV